MNKRVSFAVAILSATITPLAACANQQGNQPNASSSSAPPGTERMTTQLKTADGSQVATATFDFANGYATVTVEAGPNQVLSPGFHSLMVHAVGRCEAPDFSSAGSVYQAADHTGFPASGDLTALQVRSDGSAKLVTTTNLLTSADLRSNSGTALILHQTADNLNSAPTGESNKRIACGVIAAAGTTTSSTATTTSVTTITTTALVPPPSTSTSTVTVTSGPTSTYMPNTAVTTPPSLAPGAH